MDPVSLIVGALAAGVASGLTESAGLTVRDAYLGLRRLLGRWFADNPPAQMALEQAEHDPQTWEQPLRKYVTDTGAHEDGTVLEAAQRLMDLLDPSGAETGKYVVTVTTSGERAVAAGRDISGPVTTGDQIVSGERKPAAGPPLG